MEASELNERCKANVDLLESLEKAIDKAYAELAKAKVALERANMDMAKGEEEMTRLYQVKAYMITESDAWEESSIDPRTDEPTEDWGNMVIDRMINQDPDWSEAKADYYKRQQEHAVARGAAHEAQAKVDGLEAKLKLRVQAAQVLVAQCKLHVPIVIQQ